ncbi:MAG: hypothetical protein ABR95_11770 [Sphingobacteriales bacterium BACL12 MAG-120813-bin55]|jgi:hypothetical protein|nr:MAG: hypothetical protein ABR95_11770 [Sphingobacteriales bacterium BACL12 MAG-120813-bin55]
MKKSSIILTTALFSGIMFWTSCKETETPPVENEEELITTVELTFTNQDDPADVLTFRFSDPDGPGGADPDTFDTIRLATSSVYDLSVFLLNESVSPVEDITTEVEEEGTDHQFFFVVDPASLLSVVYADTDSNGDPIGLLNTVTTNTAAAGTLTVILKHQPDMKDGSSTTGETDIELSFITEVN